MFDQKLKTKFRPPCQEDNLHFEVNLDPIMSKTYILKFMFHFEVNLDSIMSKTYNLKFMLHFGVNLDRIMSKTYILKSMFLFAGTQLYFGTEKEGI